MWARTSAAVFAAVVGGAAGTAIAADDSTIAPPNRVGLSVGMASAVGFGGLTYQRVISRFFGAEVGVGWGLTGLQLSAMPKLVIVGRSCSYILGLGAALALGGASVEEGHGPAPATIPWLNFDALGVEFSASRGLSVSATLGLTMPLRAFHWDFAELGETVKAGSVFAQGRVGVGWRF